MRVFVYIPTSETTRRRSREISKNIPKYGQLKCVKNHKNIKKKYKTTIAQRQQKKYSLPLLLNKEKSKEIKSKIQKYK